MFGTLIYYDVEGQVEVEHFNNTSYKEVAGYILDKGISSDRVKVIEFEKDGDRKRIVFESKITQFVRENK